MLNKVDGDWKQFQIALLEWRNCPKDDGLCPSQWLFGRRQRTFAPALSNVYSRVTDDKFEAALLSKTQIESRIKNHKDRIANPLVELPIGTAVRLQNPVTKRWDVIGSVVEMRPSKRSYFIDVDGVRMLRNRRFIKPINDQSGDISDWGGDVKD